MPIKSLLDIVIIHAFKNAKLNLILHILKKRNILWNKTINHKISLMKLKMYDIDNMKNLGKYIMIIHKLVKNGFDINRRGKGDGLSILIHTLCWCDFKRNKNIAQINYYKKYLYTLTQFLIEMKID